MGRPVAKREHIYLRQRPIDPPDNLGVRNTRILWSKSHIFLDNGGYDLVIGNLEDHPHRRADISNVPSLSGIPAFHPDIPLAGQEQGVKLLGRRRFSRTIMAQ